MNPQPSDRDKGEWNRETKRDLGKRSQSQVERVPRSLEIQCPVCNARVGQECFKRWKGDDARHSYERAAGDLYKMNKKNLITAMLFLVALCVEAFYPTVKQPVRNTYGNLAVSTSAAPRLVTAAHSPRFVRLANQEEGKQMTNKEWELSNDLTEQWLRGYLEGMSKTNQKLIPLIRQLCRDLNEAHNEILRQQGVAEPDYSKYDWPEWTPQANSIRWAERETRERLAKTNNWTLYPVI